MALLTFQSKCAEADHKTSFTYLPNEEPWDGRWEQLLKCFLLGEGATVLISWHLINVEKPV